MAVEKSGRRYSSSFDAPPFCDDQSTHLFLLRRNRFISWRFELYTIDQLAGATYNHSGQDHESDVHYTRFQTY